MPTVLGRQIDAFGNAVADAPGASPSSFWDVQDLVLAAPAIVELLDGTLRARQVRSEQTSQEREQFSALAEKLLSAMSSVRSYVRLLPDGRTCEIRGIAEFDDATVHLRAILARLLEPSEKRASFPKGTLEDFVKASRSHPPEQSWFTEDLEGLRGPGTK